MADQAMQAPPGAAGAVDDIVVWSAEYLAYRWSDDHPMNPTRLDLTMSLARQIGVLEGIEVVAPTSASDEELLRIHTPAYIEA
ncbi:MAG: acetoin utilization protein AcuC, partial [Rhodococcus sp. (in: high G+C Gram-positive bacteria)]